MQKHSLLFATLLWLLSLPTVTVGQVAPGFPSFVPQDCHRVDCVDLLNNNVSLNIPVRSKAGAINFNLSLNGSYYISLTPSLTAWQPSQLLAAQFAPLTQASSYPGLDSSGHTSGTVALCPDEVSHTTELSGWYIVLGGTYHYLPPADFVDTTGCYFSSVTDTVTDNSGYAVTFTKSGVTAVHDRAGNSVGLGSITDPNGNSITFSSTSYTYTDTLGVTALTAGSGNFPNYTWTDVNGGSPQVSFTTSSTVHLKSVFNCNGVSDYDVTGQTLPSAINFPDGTSLGITYEGTSGYTGDYTGRLNQITLRTGGTVAYTYGGSNNGLNCTYQTVPTLTRKLGNGDTTTYTLAYSLISGSNYKATNTVIDPGGNKTIYTFTGFNSTGNSSTYAQVVTEVQRYQGTSNLLTTDVYCYNTVFASCSISSAPTAQVTGSIRELVVFHQISGMSTYSASDTKYDAYGDVWYSAQYDFGGTSPVRTTTITYGNCTAGCNTSSPTISAIGSNINNRPGEVVLTQNGSTVAQSNYTYDPFGKLLSMQVWNGSAFIGQSISNVYNTNGTISKLYDSNNNETDYYYVAGNYSDGCNNVYPFPTKVLNVSTGIYTAAKYDCTGGVKTYDYDPNGNPTQYCYNTGLSCSGGSADPYWRKLQTIDPYAATVTYTYPTSTSPDTSGSSFEFNSSNSIEATTITRDVFGRPINSQTSQSPNGSNFDTLSTSYSWQTSGTYKNYFETLTSQPCSTALNSSCSGVHASYVDPLGRTYVTTTTNSETVTNTFSNNGTSSIYELTALTPAPSGETSTGKRVQSAFDGLGRVTSICHIGSTANTGSGTACPSGSYTGAVDVYTYSQGTGYTTVSIQRGSQSRTLTYDALGRKTNEVTPESGTRTYFWDAAPPICYNNVGWSTPGDLGAKEDNGGNYICYGYDSLHRLIGALTRPSSGCYGFVYDTATPPSGSGITLQNTAGRLVEAYTNNDCNGTANVVTDEWFSYDEDGRITDMWELTPHSTQYYHSVATFYGNGAVASVQLASPSKYTVTFGLDGEGRLNTVADATTSKTLVSGANYFPAYGTATSPAQVQLTGTDNDQYVYDSNTGAITQYKFTVGSASLTGSLTWNPNRTLSQIATIDGFNSGGSLTCKSNSSSNPGYGYDDWGRLMSFDCGSGNWGQNFTYDIYDNLKKAVITNETGTSYNPTYSSTTNQVSANTYDSNGNTTSDGNTYGWNAFGKLAWAASSGTPTCGTTGHCIVYDAFDRMVEFSQGTTLREYWRTQAGTVDMNGATPSFGYFPAPMGGTVIINANSGSYLYQHKDWLNSARVTSNLGNNTVTTDQAYTPYGEVFAQSGSTSSQYDHFAGTTSDFYQAIMADTPNRELSIVGRWLSPDRAGAGWNRYAYPTNPNSQTDPSGLCPWCGGGSSGSVYSSMTGNCPVGDGGFAPCSALGINSSSCSIDGGEAGPCSLAGGEATAQCPDNACDGFTKSGQYLQFVAGAGGAQGYVPLSDIVQGITEWNGAFYTNTQFVTLTKQLVELQKEALTDKISLASDSPDGSNWNDIYNSLTYVTTKGGHADFSWDWKGDPSDDPTLAARAEFPAPDVGCEWSCRYGFMDQIHLSKSEFHFDTAGVNWAFPLGMLIHGIIDFGFGNLNPNIPTLP